MRNLDILRVMPVEDLAEYLVTKTQDKAGIPTNYFIFESSFVWESPSGQKFIYRSDAINDCVKWLNEEMYKLYNTRTFILT